MNSYLLTLSKSLKSITPLLVNLQCYILENIPIINLLTAMYNMGNS